MSVVVSGRHTMSERVRKIYKVYSYRQEIKKTVKGAKAMGREVRMVTANKTHYMMYENVSKGTSISPAFSTPEKLAKWLVDNNASSFGRDGRATYEQWLRICEGGYAPTMIYTLQTGLVSGVEGIDM